MKVKELGHDVLSFFSYSRLTYMYPLPIQFSLIFLVGIAPPMFDQAEGDKL